MQPGGVVLLLQRQASTSGALTAQCTRQVAPACSPPGHPQKQSAYPEWRALDNPLQTNHPGSFTPPTRRPPCPCMNGAGARSVPAVRLVGGPSPAEGLVQVQIANGTWGAIPVLRVELLDDYYDPLKEHAYPASAACRQLGYATGYARMGAFYLPPSGSTAAAPRPVVQDVVCGAGVRSLNACSLTAYLQQYEPSVNPWEAGNMGPLGVACGKGEAAAGADAWTGPVGNMRRGGGSCSVHALQIVAWHVAGSCFAAWRIHRSASQPWPGLAALVTACLLWLHLKRCAGAAFS